MEPLEVKSVAVIGAGLSGILAAAHLLRRGLDVTVFERADNTGGVWSYDPLPDADPPYPNTGPCAPDWMESDRLLHREQRTHGGRSSKEAAALRRFAPPGPVYDGMCSRNSTAVMRTTLLDWPPDTPDRMHHSVVLAYLRRLAQEYGVEDKVCFRTRVESLGKKKEVDTDESGAGRRGVWKVQTARLVTTPAADGNCTVTRDEQADSNYGGAGQSFDAIVVASGRYGEARVPDISGLAAWKRAYPDRVMHAKQYRSPQRFHDKTVLIIGAFISALEIASQLVENSAARVYMSGRDTLFDFRDKISDERVEKVCMAANFVLDRQGNGGEDGTQTMTALADGDPVPGIVVLQDGWTLTGIHHVVLATGYVTSFPFLSSDGGSSLEQPWTQPEDANDRVIVTADGKTVHNLHEDLFYVADPTLAFVGVTQFASTFSLYDVQAQVVAAVFAGRMRLPTLAAMEAAQMRRKSHLLPGTLLNSIFLTDDFVIRRLLAWADGAVTAPDQAWWNGFRAERERSRPLLGPYQDHYMKTFE